MTALSEREAAKRVVAEQLAVVRAMSEWANYLDQGRERDSTPEGWLWENDPELAAALMEQERLIALHYVRAWDRHVARVFGEGA